MKKFGRRDLQLNNKGMTLIELLIAIVILSVAIVPLMYCFVNIARSSANARRLQHTSAMAQTALENCKAYDIEEIKEKMTDGVFLTGSSLDGIVYHSVIPSESAPNDPYEYYMTNIVKEDSVYGMSLKLTPIQDSKKTVIDYEDINPTLDGVFIADITKTETTPLITIVEHEQLAFESVYTSLANLVADKSDDLGIQYKVTLTKEDVANSLFGDPYNANANNLEVKRTISIKADGNGSDVATVYVAYEFSLTDNKYYFTYADGSAGFCSWTSATYAATFPIYKNTGTNDALHPTELNKIYFYYYPAYNSSIYTEYPCVEDNIFIINNLKESDGTTARPLDVYIIKQKDTTLSDITIENAENIYDVKVEKSGDGVVNLYHNFAENIGGGIATGWDPAADISLLSSNLHNMEKITNTSEESLMYDIDIILYENASYDIANNVMSGNVVLELDGTKFDW